MKNLGNMGKKNLTLKRGNSNWWKNKTKEIESIIAEDEAKGLKDLGFCKAVMTTSTFFEGLFTQKPIPPVFEVSVPKGILRVTQMQNGNDFKWLVRNDTFGAIAEVNPKDYFEWAIKNFPDGIDGDGYDALAISLLGVGGTDTDKDEIYDKSFME